MDDTKSEDLEREAATPGPEGEGDVEGSSMFLSPGFTRDMFRSQEIELQRDLTARQQAKDARQGQLDAASAAAEAEAEAQPQTGPYKVARTPAPANGS